VYKAAPPPAFSWSGFYIGANAGYGFESNSVNLVSTGTESGGLPDTPSTRLGDAINAASVGSIPGSIKTDPRGFIGGGQIGYNWQAGWWVYGVETDFQGASIDGSSSQKGGAISVANLFGPFSSPVSVTSSATAEQSMDWFGTLRGRLGFTPFDPHMLIYGTGGLAYGHVSSNAGYTSQGCVGIFFGAVCAPSAFATGLGVTGPTPAFGSASGTQVGWAAGAGVEYAFLPNWTLKTEWIHYDLGSLSYGSSSKLTFPGLFSGDTHTSLVNTTSSANFAGDIVRVGVNYKLW
jgi:outer membrane immunogenic protein